MASKIDDVAIIKKPLNSKKLDDVKNKYYNNR